MLNRLSRYTSLFFFLVLVAAAAWWSASHEPGPFYASLQKPTWTPAEASTATIAASATLRAAR